MAIKPNHIQAALLGELLEGATQSDKYEDHEENELEKLKEQLSRT